MEYSLLSYFSENINLISFSISSFPVTKEFLSNTSTVLEIYLAESREVKGLSEAVTEVLRGLRNSCVGSKENQDSICK